MLLPIDDDLTIEEIQERFAECFPGLRITFFSKSHGWNGHSQEKDKINSKSKLGEIRKNHERGIMEIKSSDKTGNVEKEFKRAYGLFVQVYYRKNRMWMESHTSDNLTLKQLSDISE